MKPKKQAPPPKRPKARTRKVVPEEERARKMEKRREENIMIGICPFYGQERGNGRVSCEGASFHFPDKVARREYLYTYCAHPEGYKKCPLKIALEHYYERKYAENE